MIIYNS